MSDEILTVLDRALVAALCVFLVGFSVSFAGSFLVLKWRNRKTIQGLQRRFEREKPGQFANAQILQAWRSYLTRWDTIRAGLSAALWSAPFGLVVFVFLCFSPWTGIVSVSAQPPLRVTFLMVDPTAEGFRFEGDVWNQSEDRVPARASIILLDERGARVGGATGPVAPLELGPRDRGQFVISLGPSPQATHFTLHFLGEGDQELAYSKGFPETPETIVNKGRPAAKKSGRVGSR